MLQINTKKVRSILKALNDVRVLGLIVFGVVVLLVTWNTVKVLQQNYGLQKQEAELRQRNELQKLKNENLKLSNTYFETNQYLELTARRQFGKGAEGEKLYLVPKEVALSQTIDLPKEEEAVLDEEEEKSKSKLQRNIDDWLDFILNREKSS